MNKQIERLIELSKPLKEALKKNFVPSCGWVFSPLEIQYLDIYFDNGYQTFTFRYKKEGTELIVLSIYSHSQKIALEFSATEKHLEEFIKIVEDAIVTLNNAEDSLKQNRIAEKKAELLKQLQQLEGGNNE